jgi:hypothetical protein
MLHAIKNALVILKKQSIEEQHPSLRIFMKIQVETQSALLWYIAYNYSSCTANGKDRI